MDNGIYWLFLLFLIPIGIAGGKVFSDTYAIVKKRAQSDLDEIKKSLNLYRDNLRIIDLNFLQKYKLDEPDPYRPLITIFQETLNTSYNHVFTSVKARKKICSQIPNSNQDPFVNVLIGPLRVYLWLDAAKRIEELKKSIQQHEQHMDQVNQALINLDNLPAEIAVQIKSTHAALLEAIFLLDELQTKEGIHGEKIKNAVNLAKELEGNLNKISAIFYTVPPKELINYRNIKQETQKVYRILASAKTDVMRLNKNVKEWKSTLNQLKDLADTIKSKLADADAKSAFLAKHLKLSSEREELDSLRQSERKIRDNLKPTTVENLKPALLDAKQVSNAFDKLLGAFAEYEKDIDVFWKVTKNVSQKIETLDSKMRETSERSENPILWTNSKKEFDALKGKFESIPPISQIREAAELKKDKSFIAECDAASTKLTRTVSKVIADTNEMIRLWEQIASSYTQEWLIKIKALYSQVKIYDMEVNWERADNVKNLLNDAVRLLKRAKSNIPASKSLPIFEQTVGDAFLETQDLVRQKPIFEQRQNNILVRLKKINKDEQEAQAICQRSYAPVQRYAKAMTAMNENPSMTKSIVETENFGQTHMVSLQNKSVGKVEDKLDKIRRWERNAIERGKEVNKWLEKDILKQKEELAKHIQEIKAFAGDLEESLVTQSREQAVIMIKNPYEVKGVYPVLLDELQKYSAKLLRQREVVISHKDELKKFIRPIKSDYEQIVGAYYQLKSEIELLEQKFQRRWPPVYQSLKNINEQLELVKQGILDIKKRRWNKDRLLAEFDSLRRDLKHIKFAINRVVSDEEKDSAAFISLQDEYLDLARKIAEKLYAGDIENKKRAIQTAKNHINEFLPKAYNSGILVNGEQVKWSPAKIKSHLEKQVEEKKQQIININNVNAQNISIDQVID